MKCAWCEEEILPGERGNVLGGDFHKECLLRTIFGSVGHIRGRCSCHGGDEGDDFKLSPRDQARAAVAVYYELHPPETYRVSPDDTSILCLRCGQTSHHPQDVEHHYCSRCKIFHDDIWPSARYWWVTHPEAVA